MHEASARLPSPSLPSLTPPSGDLVHKGQRSPSLPFSPLPHPAQLRPCAQRPAQRASPPGTRRRQRETAGGRAGRQVAGRRGAAGGLEGGGGGGAEAGKEEQGLARAGGQQQEQAGAPSSRRVIHSALNCGMPCAMKSCSPCSAAATPRTRLWARPPASSPRSIGSTSEATKASRRKTRAASIAGARVAPYFDAKADDAAAPVGGDGRGGTGTGAAGRVASRSRSRSIELPGDASRPAL